MDMSDHGLTHPFKGLGAIANGLTGIENALMKCLLFAIGTEYTKIFKCPPEIKM
jgi:hypothetical protein